MKMHQLGTKQFIKFRVNNFQLITVHFSEARRLKENDPIVEISRTLVKFCRFNASGLDCLKEFKDSQSSLLRPTNDFYIETNGEDIAVGTYQHYQFNKIGIFKYPELDTLPYVGFSSIKESNWTIEEGKLFDSSIK